MAMIHLISLVISRILFIIIYYYAQPHQHTYLLAASVFLFIPPHDVARPVDCARLSSKTLPRPQISASYGVLKSGIVGIAFRSIPT